MSDQGVVEARCSAGVWGKSAFHPVRCTKAAKVERNGKQYCTIHDPARIEAKRAERDKAWKEKQEREKQEWRWKQAALALCSQVDAEMLEKLGSCWLRDELRAREGLDSEH